jgi:hypothetical protein
MVASDSRSWTFLGKIGEVAEAGSEGAFSKSPFVANAFHKLSVALCLLSGLLQATSHMLLAPSTGSTGALC